MSENIVTLRVWGDFACFTRPEMKVERVSYPVMTPSAARGILEAIFWEPQMYYLMDSIRVVKKGRWVSFRRNEVTRVVSLDSTQTWMRTPEKFSPIQAGGGAPDGTQRNMLALEDVEYLISAEVRLTELGKEGQNLSKYRDEFQRRAKHGKCFHRPALGVREFAADFDWEDDAQAALERRAKDKDVSRDWRTIWPEDDLGLMLYDVFDPRQRGHGFRWLGEAQMEAARSARVAEIAKLPKAQRKKAGKRPLRRWEGQALKPQAVFFKATVRDACIDCHPDRVRLVAANTPKGGGNGCS